LPQRPLKVGSRQLILSQQERWVGCSVDFNLWLLMLTNVGEEGYETTWITDSLNNLYLACCEHRSLELMFLQWAPFEKLSSIGPFDSSQH
jgi:hypothetical protein